METRQEAALKRQREREEREWLEEEGRHRRDDERQARREGRYVVLTNAPSMHDPVPPPWIDTLPWRRFEAEFQFPDQDDARGSDDFTGMIRRMLGIRTGPRSARNPRQNFDSLTPFILVPRPRFRSLNEIMYGQAGGAEVAMQEEQDDGVQFGWEEKFGPEPAEEDAEQEQLAAAENDEPQPLPYFVDLDMSEFLNLDNDGGWGQEDDVAGPVADDAVHQEAEEDAELLQPFPYFVDFDINEFLNLDYDGGWRQEDVAGLPADDAGHQDAEQEQEADDAARPDDHGGDE